ncbi:MAG: hypothetical protein ABIS47_04065 [Acidimicrobiales bacterium]
MAVNLVNLDPALRKAIEDGRSRITEELTRVAHADRDLPSVPAEVGAAVERLIADGTYARAVAAVVATDPELADG